MRAKQPFGETCNDCEVDLKDGCSGCILNQLALSILKESGKVKDILLSAREEFNTLVAESYEVLIDLEAINL